MAEELLTPEQLADLDIRRRQIRDRSMLGNQQQDYLRATATREYGRNVNDLVTAYARMRERLPFNYAKRGLINSGIYAASLARRVHDLNTGATQLADRTQDQMTGYDLAKQQLAHLTAGGLQDVDAIEAGKRQTEVIAEMIRRGQ